MTRVILTLYEEICEYLRQGILDGRFPSGKQIEPETALMKRFEVSRVTVRKAISRLVDEGLLLRRQGKGTFVTLPTVEVPLGELYSTAEVLANLDIPPRLNVLSQAMVVPELHVRNALGLGGHDRVLRIERQDFTGDSPVAFVIMNLPEWIGCQLTTDDFASESLYRLLWRKQQIFVNRAHQTLRATKADPRVANLLAISLGDPVILAERTGFTSSNRPIEYATIVYRSDIIYFSVDLLRPGPGHDPQPGSEFRAQLSGDLVNRS